MKNAHLRFGWLTYIKSTEKTTTEFKVRLDRFIGEVLPDPPRQAKAHLISVFSGDTQIAAISSAISIGERFMIEGPDIAPIRVSLERNPAYCKGALQIRDRKRPVRHLIAMSEEFSSLPANSSRTLLADSNAEFVWTSLAHIHGLPGIPEWSDWFHQKLERHQSLIPLLGLGCEPVIVKGSKQQFLSWISEGVAAGEIRIPDSSGPVQWPHLELKQLLQRAS